MKYRTIAHTGEGQLREKGSRFIGHCIAINTEEEANKLLQEYRKQYYDATHVCYAYRLGPEGKIWKASDDGEPKHSAGTPIYNAIRGRELSDVLVVVVRYYGGTQLGVRGLIDAYGGAAQMALEAAGVKEVEETTEIWLQCSYEVLDTMLKSIGLAEGKILESEYDNQCRVQVRVRVEEAAGLRGVYGEGK